MRITTRVETALKWIVWTLRADAIGSHDSVFRTETRVVTTDARARAKFRWYWARFSPGILLIRSLSLGPTRREAERRARAGARGVHRRATPAAQNFSRTPNAARPKSILL